MTFKLPHWAQLTIGLIIVVLTWVSNQQAAGALVLPAAGVTALTLALTVLGLLSGSAMTKKVAS